MSVLRRRVCGAVPWYQSGWYRRISGPFGDWGFGVFCCTRNRGEHGVVVQRPKRPDGRLQADASGSWKNSLGTKTPRKKFTDVLYTDGNFFPQKGRRSAETELE